MWSMSACSNASASATQPSRSSAATGRASCRRSISFDTRAATKKPAPYAGAGFRRFSPGETLRRQDGDDLQRVRIDDQELIADQDIFEATVFRNDGHDLWRQHRDVNGPGNGHSDADVEVRMVDTRDVAIADDDAPDLGPLVLRELDRSAASAS